MHSVPRASAVAVAIVVVVVARYLKRRAGVKDYGNYLGAHGGFMDRFDGVQFAYTVFMALTWMADLGLLESSPAR